MSEENENVPIDSENNGLPEKKPDTTDIRSLGKGGTPVPSNGVKFSSTNQPDPKKQSATKRKQKEARELLRILLKTKIKWPPGSEAQRQMKQMFGDKVDKLTADQIMGLRQIQSAILTGDTQAFKEVFNQAYGQPKQQLEHTGVDGGPIQTETVHHEVIIKRREANTTLQ